MPARRKSKSRSKKPRRVRRSSGTSRRVTRRRSHKRRTYKGTDSRLYGMHVESRWNQVRSIISRSTDASELYKFTWKSLQQFEFEKMKFEREYTHREFREVVPLDRNRYPMLFEALSCKPETIKSAAKAIFKDVPDATQLVTNMVKHVACEDLLTKNPAEFLDNLMRKMEDSMERTSTSLEFARAVKTLGALVLGLVASPLLAMKGVVAALISAIVLVGYALYNAVTPSAGEVAITSFQTAQALD